MNIRLSILTIILTVTQLCFSQQGHSYREYKRPVCINTERSYGRKPDEVYFHIQKVDQVFYAYYSDEEWFDSFFSEEGRGLGIQLVSTEYFNCDTETNTGDKSYFYNSPPVSFRDMKRNQQTTESGWFLTPLARVPQNFTETDYDFGLIITRRNRQCISHWFSLIAIHDWELLESALMTDSLVFENDPVVFHPDTLPLTTISERILEIPFEKDKITFDKEPLLNFILSLPLREYEVAQVDIQAFASIEGPENRNEELYWERAKVIFNEVSAFLPENVIYEFYVSENWDEFTRDIQRTPFSYLARKSKEEIKELCKDEKFSLSLEPILKNHRKARITIRLRKTIHPDQSNSEDRIEFYEETLKNEDMENALKIQDAIFGYISGEKTEPQFPESLPIPQSKAFSIVFNRDYAYRYLLGLRDHETTYALFEELAEIFPDSPEIRFNLAELMFRRWLLGDSTLTPTLVLNTINDLNKYDVPTEASHRILVNYHKVMVVKSMFERDERQRNRSLGSIRNLYSNTLIREVEAISLAKFFMAYHRRDIAERLLRPFARQSDPDEDVLFYYIALTISTPDNAGQRWYQQILMNAQQINPGRFCDLFQPIHKGYNAGISLLFNENLKKMYCRYCY